MKLNNLYLKSFRGATKPVTIEFDSSKKITMIFGENGNGKSTIADAFICLLTDKLGSIEDKSETDKRFVKSFGASTGDAQITLTTDTNSFSATLSGASKVFAKNPATGFPALRVLRRSQIIKLVDAQATNRYETMKDYIDVAGVFASEEELRKMVRDVEQNLTLTASNLQTAQETLEQTWIKENKPNGDYLVWAKTQSETDVSKDQKDLLTLNELLNQFRAIDAKHKEIIQAKANEKATLTTKQNAEKSLKALQTANSKISASLLQLLQEAKSYISEQDEINNCPVCDSSIKKATVVASLDKQIKSMDALENATKQFSTASKAHDKNIAIYSKAVETLSTLLIKYKNAIKIFKEKAPEIIPFVDGIGTDVAANYTCYIQNLSMLQTLNTKVETSQQTKNRNIQQHNFIKQNFKTITENNEKVEKLVLLKTASTKALAIVENSRKEFYDNELISISGEVEQMYLKLHPAEGLGGIKLQLKSNFKKSLELLANFHTETGITPQSVYSESHLDTLGTCIFIALAKKYSDGNTILILDDVVMSVDENHLDKFIQLLHDEADNFSQIIITTHYRPWKDRYKNNRAPSGNVHFLELRKWTKENGIKVYNSKIALDELKHMLAVEADYHRENISTASGRTLENILDFVTLKFSSKLPRKPKNDYQLSELLDGLSKELLKVFKVAHFEKDAEGKYTVLQKEVELKASIDKLKQLKAVRNQVGAHYNFDGSLVSDTDVEDFGNATVEFAELLICPESGTLPDRNNSGSYWETKSGSIKLYPLVDPK